MRTWQAILIPLALSCGRGYAPQAAAPPVSQPQWNVWTESYGTRVAFKPLAKLVVNRQYLLVVDLAAIRYDSVPGVYTRGISDEFDTWLKQTKDTEVGLEVLVI